ncbi:serine hydrolase domain-containing protein [Corynebacterium sp. H113]|uniref:serine hydrolase domain-containing protein n=1 Tax=Corynebacterium sp. H113 TaxID=3133419 RepID=UPI0030AE257E
MALGCPSPSYAAPPTTPPPGDEKAVTALLNDFYGPRKEATAAVAIGYFDAKDSVSAYYGHTDIENSIPTTQESVFEWGSVTKMLVWVALMQLEEQGRIDLNDDASTYLDDTGLTFDKPFTIQDLMNHQAGFAEIPYPPETEHPDEILELEEALKHYQPAQIYEPKTITSYSNYGAALAALIVEKIGKQSFSDYVQKEIFAPLEMTDTSISPDQSDNPSVSKRRDANKSYQLLEGVDERYGTARSYIQLYPAGSAIGTLKDFMTFGQALVPGSEQSHTLFDEPETLTTFFAGSTFYKGTDIIQNSHGMWQLPYGNGVLGHGGNTQGYTSTIFVDPDSARGIVVMTNEVGETSYSYGLLQEFFGDYVPGDIEPSTGEPPGLTGVYTNARANIPNDANKFLRYMSGILPLKKDTDANTYRLAIGPGKVQHIAGNVYSFDSGNGLSTLLVMNHDTDTPIMQTYTGDNVKENTAAFAARWLSVLLFLVASIVSVVALLVLVIRKLWSFFRKKHDTESGASHITATSLLFHALQAALGVSVFALLFGALGTDAGVARILAIVNGLLTVALVAVWLVRPLQKKRPTVLQTIIVLISVATVLYWRWFLA